VVWNSLGDATAGCTDNRLVPVTIADVYSALYDSPPDQKLAFVHWVATSFGTPAEARVLDMGCGTGRLIPGLAASGWRVTGYEPNPVYAAAARARVAGVQGASVVTGGFLELEEEAAFDLICAINDPFAHLTTVSDRRDALHRVRRALLDGGLFVIDNPNFLWALVNYRPPTGGDVEVLGRPAHHQARHEIDVHNAVWRHSDRVTIPGDSTEEVIEDEHTYAITTYPELEALLRDAGLPVVMLLNNTAERTPADHFDRPRMVIITRAINGQ
jgi:SAM-dependent methyltransferase